MVTVVEDLRSSPNPEALAEPVGKTELRYTAIDVPEITGLRVSPGVAATLVNISASGVLLESPQRFAPGQWVTLHFEGTLATRQMRARIVRCQVSLISPQSTLHYQTAMAFEERLTLPREGQDPDCHAATPDAPEPAPQPAAHLIANRW